MDKNTTIAIVALSVAAVIIAMLLAITSMVPYLGGAGSNCIVGSGNVISEEFTVDEFDGVNLAVPGNLYVTQGPSQPVRVEAEDNVIEMLDITVQNGKLNIDSSQCYNNIKPVNIYVSMEEVKDLSISSSGNVIGESEINSNALRLGISGSGSFDLTLNAEELVTDISGSGDINTKGTARVHNFVLSGSGSLKAFDLSTERTGITISGSGNAEVDVSQELDVSILGSGSVFYTGDAAVTQSILGSGSVIKR